MPDNTADQKADATISDFLQQCDGEEISIELENDWVFNY